MAKEKEISINLNCPERLNARINQGLLEEAIVNLIDNAIKFSQPSQHVDIIAEKLDNEIRISVQDFGSGITAEHLPRLFERFYRGDKARTRKQGGTGLGLAIVEHIAQAHGGRVNVESVPGQGSVFSILIPSPSRRKI